MPKYRAAKAVKVIGKITRGRKTVFVQLANGIIFAKKEVMCMVAEKTWRPASINKGPRPEHDVKVLCRIHFWAVVNLITPLFMRGVLSYRRPVFFRGGIRTVGGTSAPSRVHYHVALKEVVVIDNLVLGYDGKLPYTATLTSRRINWFLSRLYTEAASSSRGITN